MGFFCFTGMELRQQRRICENIRIGPRKEKGSKPDYGNFAFELRKKDLKHFPVLFKFDDNFKFSGLTILR